MLSFLFPCITLKEESDDQNHNKEPLINFTKLLSSSSAQKWRLLNGESHWKGLLRPLDIHLRRHLIHYGEMAQATNDAFNRDAHSKYAGNSRYSEELFFQSVGLDHKSRPYKYKVTKFLYATSDMDGYPEGLVVVPLSREGSHATKETNWMGYVAVAEDDSVAALGRRDVVVAWRGSVQALEWISDFMVNLVAAPEVLGRSQEEMVHQGFHSVLEEIKRLVELYKDEEISITVTGHSLGAALATLTAVDIVTNNLNRRPHKDGDAAANLIPVTAIVFGSPKVGNSSFKKVFSDHEREGMLRLLRVRNTPDVVPTLPLLGYEEVGQEVVIDTRQSQYLKPAEVLISFHNLHNLEVYLHGVAGDQSGRWWKWRKFELVVERDVALVNKGMGNLKEEYMVPESWWVEENKGMAQRDDGSWVDMGYH
ncbi:hypothetical protein V2J09_019506 [Rumex salicifolius]